jgi:hypothetical protein
VGQRRAGGRDVQAGQATVELALGLPILALVLAATVEVGLLASDQARLWHAAREAARVAAVDPDEADVIAAAERVGLTPLDVAVRPNPAYRKQGEAVSVFVAHVPEGRIPLLGKAMSLLRLTAEATMRIEQP